MRLISLTFLLIVVFGWSSLLGQDFDIRDYGAKADGRTLNTLAIQAAIDAAHSRGGGRVVVPKGVFVSGTVLLKDKVELHLKRNAVIQASTDPAHFPPIHTDTCVGVKCLVGAVGAEGVAITGKGTLDGQGDIIGLKLDSLFFTGDLDSAHYRLVERRPKWYTRPNVVQFMRCRNARVADITLANSACWVQTYTLCENLELANLKVQSDTYWNNDGIDIVDCRNVHVTGCRINSSDDGICLKSYVSGYCMTNGEIVGCENVLVENCKVRSSASAVKLGTASFGGFRNITIRNIKVYDTFRSAIALQMVSGGVLENVVVEHIRASNTGNAIFIRLGQQHRDVPGTLKQVVIRDVKVTVPWGFIDGKYNIRGPELPFFHNVFPASITGLPGHPAQDIRLENIRITYPGRGLAAFANAPTWRLWSVPEQAKNYPEFSMFGELPAWGFFIRHVDGLQLDGIRLRIRKPDYRPAFVFDDTKGLTLKGIRVKGDNKDWYFKTEE